MSRCVFLAGFLAALLPAAATGARAGGLNTGIYEGAAAGGLSRLTIVEAPKGSKAHLFMNLQSDLVCRDLQINVDYDIPVNYDMASSITGSGSCNYSECDGASLTCSVTPRAATEVFRQIDANAVLITYVSSGQSALHTRVTRLLRMVRPQNDSVVIDDLTPFVRSGRK